nr:MAG TPA: hypothetical protein [Caudoviricetes sp.]
MFLHNWCKLIYNCQIKFGYIYVKYIFVTFALCK